MEFGPRALGNRSILADPRSEDMLEAVNRRIKFREAWRPFAPVVLRDHAAEFFEGPGESPYMLLISDLKRQYRNGVTVADLRARGICRLDALQRLSGSAFRAVTHVDYSARLQVLDDARNPRLSAILRHFLSMTGCPMLLNTSFNVRGEPIVCTPLDAVRCFLNSRLDILVIGPFIVRRNVLPEALKSGKIGAMRFNAD